MRVVVTGGRNFADRDRAWRFLDMLHKSKANGPIAEILHGDCRGADLVAHAWADSRRVRVSIFPAVWEDGGTTDRGAGVKRNQQMIDQKPDYVVQFPGGTGTADCVKRAEAANIKVFKG